MPSSSNQDRHLQHQVDVVLTPTQTHYAKLVCRDCDGLWLQWLSRRHTQDLQGDQPRKLHKQTTVKWQNTGSKERSFYRSYQPRSLQLPRTPTQLIQDRLALTGYSRYNGNSIYSIPTPYLQALLDSDRITRKEDRQLIQKAIQLRTGT